MKADSRPLFTALVLIHALSWGLVNTLISLGGLALALGRAPRLERFRLAWVLRFRAPWLGGVCLGPLILVDHRASAELLAHEYGHFVQHLVLGPLYHLVIGIPSLSHALWFGRQRGGNYFHFYTEAWADAWGGVYALHQHRHPHWSGYLGLGRGGDEP